MAIAFRMMVFVLVFNLASGILNVALADQYPAGVPTGYQYNASGNLADGFNGSVSAPSAEGADGWWDKFTDFLRIGFLTKLKSIADNSVYGLVGILRNLNVMDNAYYPYFYALITIIYMIGIIDLFTSKKIAY